MKKLVRALALTPMTVVALSFGCSDPPAPPAQGAVEITINSQSGFVCNHASGQMTAPTDPPGNPNAVDTALSCDLTKGCKPDQYVLIDGDSNSNVGCTVAPSGDQYAVNVSIVNGTRITFRASGTIGPTGGMMQISEQGGNTSGEGLHDSACTVTISPNLGTIKKGAVWARYECKSFGAPNSANQEQCDAVGSFIFENCGS